MGTATESTTCEDLFYGLLVRALSCFHLRQPHVRRASAHDDPYGHRVPVRFIYKGYGACSRFLQQPDLSRASADCSSHPIPVLSPIHASKPSQFKTRHDTTRHDTTSLSFDLISNRAGFQPPSARAPPSPRGTDCTKDREGEKKNPKKRGEGIL